jgi:hypothetical protein
MCHRHVRRQHLCVSSPSWRPSDSARWAAAAARECRDAWRLSWLPNGSALLDDGTFLIANISDAGGVFRLAAGGGAERWMTEIAGRACPPA